MANCVVWSKMKSKIILMLIIDKLKLLIMIIIQTTLLAQILTYLTKKIMIINNAFMT